MIIKQKEIFNAFGDSFTVGTGASNPATKGYINILANRLGATVNNLAEGGAGVVHMLEKAWTPSVNISAVNNNNPATVLCGFNDAIRGGDNPKLLTKLQGAYTAFIANYFLASAKPASDASITKTGTWNLVGNTPSYPLKAVLSFGQTGRSTSINGDTLTFTSNGSTLVIGYIVNDSDFTGTTFSSFDVEVDGVVIDTIDTNNKCFAVADPHYSNAYCPSAYVNHNLGTGSHTIKIINKANNLLIIDYVGTLNPPSVCPPIFIGSIPKLADAGYAGRPNNPSDSTFDACTQQLYIAMKKFPGYGLVVADINNWFTEAGISGDNVHPNDLGMTQHSDSFMDVMWGALKTRSLIETSYTDANGETKMFIGINAKYNTDGTFTRINSAEEVAGLILNTTDTSNIVAVGFLTAPAGGSFAPIYTQRQNNVGSNTNTNTGSATYSGTGATVNFTINHNCKYIPKIHISPTSANCQNYYISSKTLTTFTITFINSIAGTGNIKFDWDCI